MSKASAKTFDRGESPACRPQLYSDTKSADQHWKLTGSPLARFLM